ncbi:uncharacterized protein [Temnothorax nylanderi]|uniref:uncharacterized protein n=1 Tax=Temnothorax nylanderi TaxID=102681 RepID=UPI003A89035D
MQKTVLVDAIYSAIAKTATSNGEAVPKYDEFKNAVNEALQTAKQRHRNRLNRPERNNREPDNAFRRYYRRYQDDGHEKDNEQEQFDQDTVQEQSDQDTVQKQSDQDTEQEQSDQDTEQEQSDQDTKQEQSEQDTVQEQSHQDAVQEQPHVDNEQDQLSNED